MRTSHRLLLCLSLAAASSVSTAGLAAAKPRYRLTDLGATGAQARAVNSQGLVIGAVQDNAGGRPFLWKKGHTRMLNVPADTASASALGINTRGTVVGTSYLTGGFPVPTVFTPSPEIVLPPDGSSGGIANAINDKGKIGGAIFGANGSLPAIWSPGGSTGSWALIDTLGAGQVVALNNKGGALINAGTSFLWKNGQVSSVGLLEGYMTTTGSAVNDAGVICGTAYKLNGNMATYTPFVWEKGRLKTLPIAPSGANAWAMGVNNKGQIAGVSADHTGYHPLLWQKQGSRWKVTDLKPLIQGATGWDLTTIAGINNKGQIAGWGSHQGQIRSFLLTPR
jgi:uncharacterized membrane protein